MKKLSIILLFLTIMILPMAAQQRMPAYNLDTPQAVVERITTNYSAWNNVEFSGKLKTQKLPISPTIKLYMERDSLIQLSLRAPLLGEVGRITIDNNRIQAVNKMKRVYADESTDNLLEIYPNLISDLQSLLLARVVILGQGELTAADYDNVEVEGDLEGGYMLLPNLEENALKFNYGYLINGNGRTKALVAYLPANLNIELIYTYLNNGLQIGVTIDDKGKQDKGDVEFSSVKWGGSRMSPLKVMNYKKVSVKEFIKSLK